MTADQLAERLSELRRKYRIEIDEAKRKEDRVKALFEELYGLGCGKLRIEDWHQMAGTPQEHRDRYVENLRDTVRLRFYQDAYELIKEWTGIP